MDNKNRKQRINIKREKESEINYEPIREKVNYDIEVLIRAYPDDYSRIMEKLADFVKNFD